jgi:hypothetical protein
MKQADREDESLWQKTHYSNLIRYKPSQAYFARIRINGKLIRRALKTKVLSVAKLRLGDLDHCGFEFQQWHEQHLQSGRASL